MDLDPALRDLDGLPVARVTYRHHAFELSAREHYLPEMARVMKAAGGRAADGALFPTSSGYNPILTITAIGAWVAASMLDGVHPAVRLPA